VRLGRWRWPAAAFCALVALLGIGAPVTVLAYWLIKGLSEGESTSFLGRPSGIPCSHPGWPRAAHRRRRAPSPPSPSATRAAARSCSRACPIELAAGHHRRALLVYFAANFAGPTLPDARAAILAYAIRFLPEAMGACRASLLQVNPHTEEAARGLGAGRLRVFTRITLPQVLPGMTAGGVLAFLTAMKELQITLLLSPIGFETLATQTWASSREAFFTQAALPALLLVGIAASRAAHAAAREDTGVMDAFVSVRG
jgi:iron(III) transport system permease protein